MSPTQTLRALVRQSLARASLRSLSALTGVNYATLQRFSAGGDIKGQSIDRLANHYGLKLREKQSEIPGDADCPQ